MHSAATRLTLAVAASAMALALVGCSGSTARTSETTESPTATPTVTASAAPENPADNVACQLISAADIEAITALPFSTSVPEVSTSTEESEDCEFWLDEAVGNAGVIVQFMAGQADMLATTRGVAATSFGDVVDVEVEGTTGTFTYVGGTVLTMAVGDDLIQITYVTFVSGDPTPALVGLATNIVANN